MSTDGGVDVSAQTVAQVGGTPGDIVWQRIVYALGARVVKLSNGGERLQFMRNLDRGKKSAKNCTAQEEEPMSPRYMRKGRLSDMTEQELALKVVGKHWPGTMTQHYVISFGYE